MRDKRFIAAHRGGPLTKERHFQLMLWACSCAEHVLPYFGEKPDHRLINAIQTGRNWTNGSASVGEARKAAVGCLVLARELNDPVSVAVVRAAGHAVATAHMADHSPGASLYALKAVNIAGGSPETERKWQDAQLPDEIRELALSGRSMKEIHFSFTKKNKLPSCHNH